MIRKDFLASLAQWPLCSVVLGHSFSLLEITLQVGRTWKTKMMEVFMEGKGGWEEKEPITT